MNKMDLYRACGAVDDDILVRSESTKTKTFRFRWQHALIAAIKACCQRKRIVLFFVLSDRSRISSSTAPKAR